MLVRMGLFMWSHLKRPYSYCVYIRGLYRVIRLEKAFNLMNVKKRKLKCYLLDSFRGQEF